MDNIIYLKSDYLKGYASAKEEIASGEIYCVESALMMFKIDPPENDFQRGYKKGLLRGIH